MPTLLETQANPRYGLASHAFVCLDGDHVVVLDVKRDRYLSLEEAKSRCLSALIRGWPRGAVTVQDNAAVPVDAGRVVQLLISRELLTRLPSAGKDATPARIEKPERGFAPDDYLDRPPLSIGAAWAFLAAVARTRYVTRFWSFERIVRRVERRNRQHLPGSPWPVLAQLQTLVATFGELRPFLFTSREACLFESFALLEFLAHHGVYAHWVFGVQARPFAAHCWVQRNGVVLNDSVENAGGYTPIMVV